LLKPTERQFGSANCNHKGGPEIKTFEDVEKKKRGSQKPSTGRPKKRPRGRGNRTNLESRKKTRTYLNKRKVSLARRA